MLRLYRLSDAAKSVVKLRAFWGCCQLTGIVTTAWLFICNLLLRLTQQEGVEDEEQNSLRSASCQSASEGHALLFPAPSLQVRKSKRILRKQHRKRRRPHTTALRIQGMPSS